MADIKAEVEALVANISDKSGGQAALERLGALAQDKGRQPSHTW
jgi:hypothetical protein